MLEVLFKAHKDDEDQRDKVGKIIIVDCAGSEDPASIMKDYVDFAADGAQPTNDIADARALRYLKLYDAQHAGKPKLWNTQEWDQVVSGIKMEAWQVPAAEQWLKTQPDSFKAQFGATSAQRDKRKFKQERDRDDKLRLEWSKRFLVADGIIATVKEGVFINESLNHLKQFLLLRAGKVKSLLQILSTGEVEMLNNPKTNVPGVTVKAPWADEETPLPTLNTWDFDKAAVSPFEGVFHEMRPNRKYDPVPSFYHPKQFLKPWDERWVWTNRMKYRRKAKNTDSLISSARCAYNWPTSGDLADSTLNCNDIIVDGNKLSAKGRGHLDSGEIPIFDPVLMISMLNYFDHPEYFGKPEKEKPTKFLMMAALRREHPEESSSPPPDKNYDAHGFKRLKYNICNGAKATLEFADEMNPLSKRFSTVRRRGASSSPSRPVASSATTTRSMTKKGKGKGGRRRKR